MKIKDVLAVIVGLAAIAFVCGLVYFLGHVNKEEEIHITQ